MQFTEKCSYVLLMYTNMVVIKAQLFISKGSDMVDMSVLGQRAERFPILPPKYMVLIPEDIIFTREIKNIDMK